MVKRFTVYGERCSGTSYIEKLIIKNFNAKLTWNFGWKHFFGFQDDKLKNSDDVLFVCIVRELPDWINSFYRTLHHVPHISKKTSDNEKINELLNEEFYSTVGKNEIMEDRNIYTGERYKNIFELRHTKMKWMIDDLPNKVKNYIFIRHEDLVNNFDEILLKIKDKGLEVRKDINFPLNITRYVKNCHTENYVKKDNELSNEFILSNPNLIPLYEDMIYNKKK